MRRQRTLPPPWTHVPAAGFEMSIGTARPSAVLPKPLNGMRPSKTAGAEAEPVTWIAAAPALPSPSAPAFASTATKPTPDAARTTQFRR